MSRIYDNPNQAIYDRLVELHAEAIQTNNLLGLILEVLRRNEQAGGEERVKS